MSGLLDQVRIASPCPMSWARMRGNLRVRYCGRCRLHVYNLSSMTHEEATALIKNKEGRLCARIFYRRDGTVMTKDCPEGIRALRRSKIRAIVSLAAMAATAAIAALLALDGSTGPGRTFREIVTGPEPAPALPVAPSAGCSPAVGRLQPLMGDVILPPPPVPDGE